MCYDKYQPTIFDIELSLDLSTRLIKPMFQTLRKTLSVKECPYSKQIGYTKRYLKNFRQRADNPWGKLEYVFINELREQLTEKYLCWIADRKEIHHKSKGRCRKYLIDEHRGKICRKKVSSFIGQLRINNIKTNRRKNWRTLIQVSKILLKYGKKI